MNSNDIFDQMTQDEMDVFDEISFKKKGKGKFREIAPQALTGIAESPGLFGDLLDLLGVQAKEQLPGEKLLRKEEFRLGETDPIGAAFLDDDDILPRFSRLPTTREIGEAAQEFGAPGEPETMAGRFARRGGRAVGTGGLLGGGLRALASLLFGSQAGQAIEELTGSKTAGDISEFIASLTPSALKAKIAPAAKEKALAEAGRKLGLSEKQLTPLFQHEGKLQKLGKFARKGDKTEKLITSIESSLGDGYEFVRAKAANLPAISTNAKNKIISDFGDVLIDLKKTIQPSPEKEQAIKYLTSAVKNLKKGEILPEALINTFQDINQFVNWRSISNGKKQLSRLKKPISNAISSADKSLSIDFEHLNALYGRFKKAEKVLKPDIIDKWINKGEVASVLLSIATGHPSILKHIATEIGLRKLSTALLTNPRLHGMQRKLLTSIKSDKPKSAAVIGRQIVEFLQKEMPESLNDNVSTDMFDSISRQK